MNDFRGYQFKNKDLQATRRLATQKKIVLTLSRIGAARIVCLFNHLKKNYVECVFSVKC
jgi:hypothetical protein